METMMKLLFTRILLFCSLVVAAGLFCQAQEMNHYPAGVEGIKGSTLPPPGFYLRDYNYIYISDYMKPQVPKSSFDLFANVQAPRLVWITNQKLLGGNLGMDVLVPFVYQDLDTTTGSKTFRGNDLSLGDIFVEPITLSWHMERFDLAFGYGIWMPTGDYNSNNPVSPGKGFFTYMLTGGLTVYTDEEKTWSLSALGRYEISPAQDQTKITPGHYFTIEYGLAKSIKKNIEAGLVGYVQAQTTTKSFPSSMKNVSNVKDSAIGVGPEVTYSIPKLGLGASLRYLYEMGAKNQTEGQAFNITITKNLCRSPL
jgi:hypothetical protein